MTPHELKFTSLRQFADKRPTPQPDMPAPGFPATRLRRNRRASWSRRLVRECSVSADDLIWPIFITSGDDLADPVPSMPGVSRHSIDRAVKAAEQATRHGIPVIALFPDIDAGLRRADAAEAVNPDNLVCRAVRAIKREVPDIGVMCDVALDPYTNHGHDGLMDGQEIANDESVEMLVTQALIQAEAGCDIVAPSAMMDGCVGAIRQALESAGLTGVNIMAYSAKYASGFYGPFRDAVASSATLRGDKKTYQMDPANSDEALREIALDIAEGADMVIVKPGLACLDILYRVKETFSMPVFAYQVSGEYAMLKAACDHGWLDPDRVVMETLIACKRAGATGILTYFALDVAKKLAVSS